jgi:hypothetical protein
MQGTRWDRIILRSEQRASCRLLMDDVELTTAVAERRTLETAIQSDSRPVTRAPTTPAAPASAAATWSLQQVLDPSFWAHGWQDLLSSSSPPPPSAPPSTATPPQQQRRDPLNRFDFFAGGAPRAPDATTWAQVRTAAFPGDDHSED